MSGRKTGIEATYRVNIPGILLPHPEQAEWHPFIMNTDDLLELYQAIKQTLNLT